jgi:hypothetical protein
MKAIAQECRRFGYRRLHVLLTREGYVINHKKLFRLYREACGAPPWRSQAGDRDQGTDDGFRSTSSRISSPTAAASAS